MSSKRIELRIDGDTIVCIHDDDLVGLYAQGSPTIRRASNVEPTPDGQWTAEMTDGALLGPYPLRREALAAEVAYLREKLFSNPLK